MKKSYFYKLLLATSLTSAFISNSTFATHPQDDLNPEKHQASSAASIFPSALKGELSGSSNMSDDIAVTSPTNSDICASANSGDAGEPLLDKHTKKLEEIPGSLKLPLNGEAISPEGFDEILPIEGFASPTGKFPEAERLPQTTSSTTEHHLLDDQALLKSSVPGSERKKRIRRKSKSAEIDENMFDGKGTSGEHLSQELGKQNVDGEKEIQTPAPSLELGDLATNTLASSVTPPFPVNLEDSIRGIGSDGLSPSTGGGSTKKSKGQKKKERDKNRAAKKKQAAISQHHQADNKAVGASSIANAESFPKHSEALATTVSEALLSTTLKTRLEQTTERSESLNKEAADIGVETSKIITKPTIIDHTKEARIENSFDIGSVEEITAKDKEKIKEIAEQAARKVRFKKKEAETRKAAVEKRITEEAYVAKKILEDRRKAAFAKAVDEEREANMLAGQQRMFEVAEANVKDTQDRKEAAATTLQARFRGNKARQELAKKKELDIIESAGKMFMDAEAEVSVKDTQDRKEAAATTLQARFRGNKARQELAKKKELDIIESAGKMFMDAEAEVSVKEAQAKKEAAAKLRSALIKAAQKKKALGFQTSSHTGQDVIEGNQLAKTVSDPETKAEIAVKQSPKITSIQTEVSRHMLEHVDGLIDFSIENQSAPAAGESSSYSARHSINHTSLEQKIIPWIAGHIGGSNQGRTSTTESYKSNFSGASFGTDFVINEKTIVGAAYSNINTRIKYKGIKTGDIAKVDTNSISLYGQYSFTEDLFLQSAVGYTQGLIKNTLNTTKQGTYKVRSKGIMGFATINKAIALTESIVAIPRLGLRYITNKDKEVKLQDGTVITGSKNRILTGILGSRFVLKKKCADGTVIMPAVYAGLEQNIFDKTKNAKAYLEEAGKYFEAQGIIKGKKMVYNLGAEIAAKKNNLILSISYQLFSSKKYFNHQGTIKLGVAF